jgi:Kdo2-lipid IVA lauroyltransferase/acyltransferase
LTRLRLLLEYALLRAMFAALGALPLPLARVVGAEIGDLAFVILPRLRRVGMKNLRIAFPELTAWERRRLLYQAYRHLGWQIAEFCHMARYTRENQSSRIRYDGLENYLQARDLGHGVLIVTGHLGAWELSSYYHSLMGYPMSMVIRRLDNPYVDAFVNRIRCLHGNQVLHKDDFARGLLSALRSGDTVGILMDTNMTPPQGVFVPFFGVVACTAAGLARVAQKTGAAVLPGFMLWEPAEKKYVLHFGPQIPLVSTGDEEADTLTNTAAFTQAIESYVRQYPDQWLWVHRRWKTRPPGEPPIY